MSNAFAYPGLLFLLAASPICSVLLLYAFFRRRRMVARLASPLLLRKSSLVSQGTRSWRNTCLLTAVALLAVACAGPQWGIDKNAQVRTGRDVIVVLDLSRSMSAEQPSRRELAVRSLRDLANRFETHGGNRVALVGFAARPRLFFPLTQDCDHLRHTLDQILADDYPSLFVEEPTSGTRIGAALELAANSFDPKRVHRPLIVLLSDGDDPAGDNEWRQGIEAAKARHIQVHVVGIGDPVNAETIPAGRDVLTFEGSPVRTKLQEKPLQEIALATGGSYLAARRDRFPLGAVVLQLIDADDLREETLDDPSVPVYQLRYAWFLLPAVLLFLLTMTLNEGPRCASSPPAPKRWRSRPRLAVVLTALLAIAMISAAYPPDVETLVRQGNDAFERQDYAAAIDFYQKAEGFGVDPGQISFNKAAAFYRLERYREAIECYRRALDDNQAPVDRRARAAYDLGNALQQYAPEDVTELAAAVASYRECLAQPNLDAGLRDKARHNLELAQVRWLKARALPRNAEAMKKEEQHDTKYPEPPKDPKEGPDKRYVKAQPKKGSAVKEDPDAPEAPKTADLKSDRLLNLPDENKVMAAPEADTLATLADHARRIAEARRQQRNPAGSPALSRKDW